MVRRGIYLIGIILLIGISFFYFSRRESSTSPEDSRKEGLATCLSEKAIKVYTITTCSHCSRQKEIFGLAFSKISHIDCSKSLKMCTEIGIDSVPTWGFPREVNIDQKVLSCEECTRQENGFFCEEPCYTFWEGENEFRITGFMELEQLSKITDCPL